MNRRLLRVALLLFGLGMTALIYQVAWMRELRLIFGFSTAASAAVLAIFMGGLGAGSWLLGRRADRVANPLAFYGRLELAVAGSAAATPLWVFLVRQGYVALGGTLRLGLAAGTLVRLLFSAVVLCVPTVLMGGTLPAATRSVETDEDSTRRSLALLYGSNTIGAVAGTVLSTFLLLETFGTRMTLWLACVVNALVGLAAVRLSKTSGAMPVQEKASKDWRLAIRDSESAPGPQARGKQKQKRKRREEGVPVEPRAKPLERPRACGFVLASAGIVGFAFFLMELVWYRMLAPLLGGSTYTFGLILAIALAGIGSGSAVFWLAGSRKTPTLSGFAATCALEALCLAVPYALGDRLAVLAILLRPIGAFGFSGFVAGWSLVAGLVVFPASFVAGLQFPLLIALLGKGRAHVGSDVGIAYAWNTIGGIAGSLAGGFGLLPLLSATGTWVFVAGFLSALGLFALLLSLSRRERAGVRGNPGGIWVPIGAAAVCLFLLRASGPTAAWRHSPIGAGRVELEKPSPNTLRDWLQQRRRILAWEKDGVESSVAVLKGSEGYAFVISGKTDGSSRGDAATQVMGGLIGAALHSGPRRALVIGLGTGSTTGWLAAVPSIERVDVVELEPAILRVARDSSPVNHGVLGNPRVRIWIGDAREWLLTSRDEYDIIFSEPSNPYRAGISSLFTTDFYRAARSRLAPSGIFLQWLQAYEVDSGTVRTVYATLQSAFPEVETWHTKQSDLILAATKEPIVYDGRRLRERLAQEPYVSALRDAWEVSDLEGFLSHYVARSSLARTLVSSGPAPLNTDDANVVEFAFARSLGHDIFFDVDEMRRIARSSQEDRPPISGDVDWASVNRLRVAAVTSQGKAPTATAGMTVEELRQALAQKSFVEARPEAVLTNGRAQRWEPRGPVEEVVLAEALAQGGEEIAVDLIERIRQRRGIEADVLLARLRWRQGRLEEAVQALERAFRMYREDPWPLPVLVRNSFAVVLDIASRDAGLAARLEESLAEPFSLFLLDEERRLIRLEVASRLDASRYARAVGEMEPDVPWRRPILERRAQVYAATGNPLAPLARRELAKFMENEPASFASAAAEMKR